MKKSWHSKSTRKYTNKYQCDLCSHKQEKARRINQIKKGMLNVAEN